MIQKMTIGQSKNVKIINIIKIALIIFISFSIVAYFYPFYTDSDSLVYGITTISLANGSYSYTSDLLKETGLWEFVPIPWVKTIDNTAVPKTGVGIYGISTISYLLGSFYGLFYIGPIFSILFLIAAERIATNLFGRFVGLLTLIFLVSDFTILIIARQLMTDNIFSLFFIIGCFFLIKFLRAKKNKFILISSIFFATTAFIRMPGVIFFPIEIFVIVGFFVYENISIKKMYLDSINLEQYQKLFPCKKRIIKFFKIGIFLAIPWIVFILFILFFNTYYFGDPLTTYQDISKNNEITGEGKSITSFFQFDSKFFEYTKYYSVSLLPDSIKKSLMNLSSTENSPPFERNWIGLFSLLIFVPVIVIAFYDRTKRKEVIIFSLFIVAWISFHSSNYIAPSIENHPTTFLRDRYMIPMLPLFYMFFGFVIDRIWKVNFKSNSINRIKLSIKSFRYVFIILVFVLMFSSLYSSQATADILKKQLRISNPTLAAERYPLDMEGLPEDSVIVGGASRKILEYNLTSFFPYWGMGRYTEATPETIPKGPIENLKKIMNEGYETYMFKGGLMRVDLPYFEYLEAEHGIILQNYSKTFCKLEIINSQTELSETDRLVSDGTCFVSTSSNIQCVESICYSVDVEWVNNRQYLNP